jgi:hypothetical protein
VNMKDLKAALRKRIISESGVEAWTMPTRRVPNKKRYNRTVKHTNKETE